jgi:hypothetical protein
VAGPETLTAKIISGREVRRSGEDAELPGCLSGAA